MTKKDRKIILLSDDEVANEHYGFTQTLAKIFKKAGVDTSTSGPMGVFVSGAMTQLIIKEMHKEGYRLAIVGANNNNPQSATVTKKAYNIGDVLPDGWVVGPRAPETGIIMGIEPVSCALRGRRTWEEGENHAKKLRKEGNIDARQASLGELRVIYEKLVEPGYNHKAKFGRDSYPGEGYWSTGKSVHYEFPIMVYFGKFFDSYVGSRSLVRCVRDEPKISLI